MKNSVTTEKPLAEPLQRIVEPLQRFLHAEKVGGVVLLVFAVGAIALANSPFSESYFAFWKTKIGIGWGEYELSKPLLLWINDGLMAIFFFVVGLQIKREILVGELASFRRASLPLIAAFGGMIVPALIYLTLNYSGDGQRGWGIPMATDIAFALGVLSLFGNRIPVSAKVFLVALAIVDDIGASLVIALFYSDNIWWQAVAVGGMFWVGQWLLNFSGVRNAWTYALLGFGLWLAFLKSGIHPTIAGVLGAMTIPAFRRIDGARLLSDGRYYLTEFAKGDNDESVLTSPRQRGALQGLEKAARLAQTPLQRLEQGMHPWVVILIMPVFALANAGVSLQAGEANLGLTHALTHPVTLGTILGLVAGKPLGIFLFTWVGSKLGLVQLPSDMTWRHVFGISLLGGIGFTMSLFIAGLAFGDQPLLGMAKTGILIASAIAGITGWFVLRFVSDDSSGE